MWRTIIIWAAKLRYVEGAKAPPPWMSSINTVRPQTSKIQRHGLIWRHTVIVTREKPEICKGFPSVRKRDRNNPL